jgi:hypothetical protein
MSPSGEVRRLTWSSIHESGDHQERL